MVYHCGKCGKLMENITERGTLRCPFCGYKILFKSRPPTVKRVKAR
jgi:DNA-directed RNA polymerase subunit P